MTAVSPADTLGAAIDGDGGERFPGMPLGHYAQLIRFKVSSELRSEAERTYVGFLWWLVDPIVSMLVYYLVFAVLFERGGPGFVPFLFIGLLTFRWLNTCVCHGAVSIAQETRLMQQVYLPKLLFPIVSVLVDTVKFACAFVLLLGFLLLLGHLPELAWSTLPLVLLVEFLLILGLSFVFAAMTPFFPDLDVMLSHLFRMLFFVSGVFYSIDSIPSEYQFALRLNPMATLIEAYRDVLLEGRLPEWPALVATTGLALGLLLVGAGMIRTFDRVYPKIS